MTIIQTNALSIVRNQNIIIKGIVMKKEREQCMLFMDLSCLGITMIKPDVYSLMELKSLKELSCFYNLT